ncbi:Hypothetical predicted protein [Paramuricea clavata]|uniref:Uncharacterized protein n=1 Tax=Paramuricea clavata TaxID=317549 RepID=A0A7D9LJA8_PARCT|nr:Hypothetical predicted protein [Paramuricea clavata]
MDRRRCSPSFWQDLGIIPASMGDRHPRPQKVHDENLVAHYPRKLRNTKRSKRVSQKEELFDMLKLENVLDQAITVRDNGFLERNGRQLSGVEICNELDNVTSRLVNMHIQGVNNAIGHRQHEE